MSNESVLKEIHTTVMPQTYDHIQRCMKVLHLSDGEVIDRAITTIISSDPFVTASWAGDQFLLAASIQDDDTLRQSIFLMIALFVRLLLQEGMSMDDIISRVQQTIAETEKNAKEL